MVLQGRHWPACSCWESFMALLSPPALGGWFSLWPCAPAQTCPMPWHNLAKTSPDFGAWKAFVPLLVPGCACHRPWCAGRQERPLLAPPGIRTKLSRFRGERWLQTPVSHPDPSCMAGEEQPGTEGSRDIVLSPVCAQNMNNQPRTTGAGGLWAGSTVYKCQMLSSRERSGWTASSGGKNSFFFPCPLL